MAQSLEAAVDRLQAIAGGLAGIVNSPDDPPEQANRFPLAITYPQLSTRTRQARHIAQVSTIVTELHFSRSAGLPHAVQTAMPYHDLFLAAVDSDRKLSGAVRESDTTAAEMVFVQWDEADTVCWRFTTSVEIWIECQ